MGAVHMPKTTYEGMRALVDGTSKPPRAMTPQEYVALSEDEREDFDEERIAWFGDKFVLDTAQAAKLRTVLKTFRIQASSVGGFGCARVIFLDGRPHIGKTTTLLRLIRETERDYARRVPNFRDLGHTPVVYVEATSKATPKTMASAVLSFFGIPHNGRWTQAELTTTAVDALNGHHTKVLMVDEMQMLRLNSEYGDDAVNGLKTIINNTGVVAVLSGADVMPTLRSTAARQLLARGVVEHLRPFTYTSAESRSRWALLLQNCTEQMHLMGGTTSDVVEHADVLLAASSGCIGDLRVILSLAQSLAIFSKDSPESPEVVTPAILANAIEAYGGSMQTPATEPPKKTGRSKKAAA